MNEQLPAFQRIQWAFTAHIRDSETHPPPAAVAPERVAAYRALFFNNIEHFIASGFPVLKSLHSPDAWQALIRHFYATHRCQTPLFIGIAEEFLAYLQQEREPQPGDAPFLLELAHYEWVELALAVATAEPPGYVSNDSGSVLDAVLARSPVAWPLVYRFPVHRIGPDFQPHEPPMTPTFLVVYRDRDDDVRFLEINQVTYRLLELLAAAPDRPLRHILAQIAKELEHPDLAEVMAFGAELVTRLHDKGVLGIVARG